MLALLLTPGQARSTDQLIDDLWGDDPPGDPGSSLRAYVSNLRKIIEPNRAKGAKPSMLVRRGNGYALSVDAANVDSLVFERSLVAANETEDPQTIIDGLQAGLDLWRGPAFVDAAFENFAFADATRLNNLRVEAELRIADALLAVGRATAAVAVLEPTAQRDELNESVRVQLARALYLAGRQSDALRVVDAARQMLLDELGLDPSPELREMEQRILNHDADLGPTTVSVVAPPIATGETAVSPHGPAGVESQPNTNVLPGRELELTALVNALDATAAGDGTVAVVSGPAGLGKSRLLEELVGPAASRGATVVWARCDAGASTLPLWPWSTALRDMLEGRSDQEQREILGTDHAALAAIIPGLGDAALGAGVDEVGRFRVFDATTRVLRRMAEKEPLVWVLEDAHWADEASLEMATFVARRLRGSGVLLAVSSRPEGLEEAHIAELRHMDGALDLQLGPLPTVALEQLVIETIGERADAQEIALALAGRCGGNPFFAVQLLRVLDPGDPLGSLEGSAAPESVAAALVRRLADLPPGAEEILTTATSAQAEWGIDIAAHVAGVDLDQAIEVMEAALSAGLVEEEPDRIGHYRFSHALVRETLAGRVSAMRTAQMYARIGEQIEARRSTDEPAVVLDLARHYCIGAPAGSAIDGAEWSLRAAPLAIARFDAARALQLVEDGRAALAHAPAGPSRTQLEVKLVCMAAEALRRNDRMVDAHQSGLEAWGIAKGVNDVQLMASAAMQYTGEDRFGPWIGYWFDDTKSAQLIDEVLSHPDAHLLDAHKRVRLYTQLADSRHDGRPGGVADEYTQKALAVAREVDDPVMIIESLWMRHRAAQFKLSDDELRKIVDELLTLAKGAGHIRAELLARRLLLLEAINCGDTEVRDEQLREFELLSHRSGDEAVEFMTAWLPLAVKVWHGDLDGAEAGLGEVAERFGHFPPGPLDALNLLLTQILRERHMMDSIESVLRERLAVQDSPAWRGPLLLVLTEHGRFDEAQDLLDQMPEADFTQVNESVLQFMTVCLIADAVAHVGDAVRAQQLVDHLERYRHRLVCFGKGMQYHGWMTQYLGRLYTVLGRFDDAEASLADAMVKSRHEGAILSDYRIQVAQAELALARGESGAADTATHIAAEARQRGYEGIAAWADRVATTAAG